MSLLLRRLQAAADAISFDVMMLPRLFYAR